MKVSKEEFITTYASELAKCFATDTDYAYSAATISPEKLAEKMYSSFKAGTANKDGKAIQRTLKRLGIKNTYKAIKEALN